MLDDCNNNEERWQVVDELLQRWLSERREVLVKYAAIAATMERAGANDALEPGLQRLCQILVDYVSAGHFEVFQQLIGEAEAFADGSSELGKELIPSIVDTTDVILGFDEKYAAATVITQALTTDMSLLGEVLETRFELEDSLIAALHRSHAS